MGDTVITKQDIPETLKITGLQAVVAQHLSNTYKGSFSSINSDLLADFMVNTSPEARTIIIHECKQPSPTAIEHYINDVKVSAQIVVAQDHFKEVAVPDVKKICSVAGRIGI